MVVHAAIRAGRRASFFCEPCENEEHGGSVEEDSWVGEEVQRQGLHSGRICCLISPERSFVLIVKNGTSYKNMLPENKR